MTAIPSFRTPWQQDRRLRARRLACQRAAVSALAEVEARRKAAEESVAARERSTATIRTKLRGQEEADQVKLQASFLLSISRRDCRGWGGGCQENGGVEELMAVGNLPVWWNASVLSDRVW